MRNVLIVYFSPTGVTKNIAERIASENGYDSWEIEPVEKYTPEDLNYTNPNSRTSIEMNDKSYRPSISQRCYVQLYDTIVIGFPVWWYTAPRIINTFIEGLDLSGKTIKVFCTSGGSGVDGCVKDLQDTYPTLYFSKGMRFDGDVSKAKEWIEE